MRFELLKFFPLSYVEKNVYYLKIQKLVLIFFSFMIKSIKYFKNLVYLSSIRGDPELKLFLLNLSSNLTKELVLWVIDPFGDPNMAHDPKLN